MTVNFFAHVPCLLCALSFMDNTSLKQSFRQKLTVWTVNWFFQGFELMLLSLGDPSERVVSAVHQVFIPAFAAWTTELATLHTALIPALLARIEKLLMVSGACSDINITIGTQEM